jgi:tetratricopeptide (TPR) repeat protein
MAVQKNPAYWQANIMLGRLVEYSAMWKEAIEAYEKAFAVVGRRYPPLEQLLARARKLASAPLQFQQLSLAEMAMRKGDYVNARKLYEEALTASPSDSGEQPPPKRILATSHFNLAVVLSLASTGKKGHLAEPGPIEAEKAVELQGRAIDQLRLSLEHGYTDLAKIQKALSFAPIRDLPEFKALMKEWEERLSKGKSEGEKGGSDSAGEK